METHIFDNIKLTKTNHTNYRKLTSKISREKKKGERTHPP